MGQLWVVEAVQPDGKSAWRFLFESGKEAARAQAKGQRDGKFQVHAWDLMKGSDTCSPRTSS